MKLKFFLKKIKWLFYFFIIWFVILFASVYISSLWKYTDNDFNIPKDAFKTKFSDKDTESEKNWFKNFIELTEKLNENLDKFKYLDFDSKCSFDTKKDNNFCENWKKNELKKIKDDFIIQEFIRKYWDIDWEEKLKSKLDKIEKFKSFYHIESIDKEIDDLDKKLNKLKLSDIDFYNVFNYLDDKKVYWEYKIFLERMWKVDKNIKSMADIWRIIDKTSNNINVDKNLISSLDSELKKLYHNNITLNDFIDYNKYSNLFEENKEKILKEKIKQFKIYTYIINKKLRNIEESDFIKPTMEYIWIYEPDKWQNYSWYWYWKNISYSWILQYFRISRLLIYKYFEEWKYEKWINLWLENQKFMDFYLNKYDWDLTGVLVWIVLEKDNLNILNHILKKYNISNELNEKIKNILNKELDKWLTKNALKNNHIVNRTFFQYLWDDIMYDISKAGIDKNTWKKIKKLNLSIESFKTYLFYNPRETEILSDKFIYEYITNWKYPMDLYNKICVKDEKTWNIKKYNLSFNNLHNFIWRFLICTSFPFYYDKQFEKEQNIRVLRENILNNLN